MGTRSRKVRQSAGRRATTHTADAAPNDAGRAWPAPSARVEWEEASAVLCVKASKLIPAALEGWEAPDPKWFRARENDAGEGETDPMAAASVIGEFAGGVLFGAIAAMGEPERAAWGATFGRSGTVLVEAVSLGVDVGLILTWEPSDPAVPDHADGGSRLSVRIAPGHPQLLADWQREEAALNAEFEPGLEKLCADGAYPEAAALRERKDSRHDDLRQAFGRRYVATLGTAEWIGADRLRSPSFAALRARLRRGGDLVGTIEAEFAARRRPRAADGAYQVRVLRDGAHGGPGLVVRYRAPSAVPCLHDCIDAAKAILPAAFRRPLLRVPTAPRLGAATGVVAVASGVILGGELSPDDVGALLGQVEPGAQGRVEAAVRVAGWEAFGWFQPFHDYRADRWGIYLRSAAVVDLAAALADRLRRFPCARPLEAVRLALRLVWEHEYFHARVETFALGQELAGNAALYRRYVARVYRTTVGTPSAMEEALANWTSRDELTSRLLPDLEARRGWDWNAVDATVRFIDDLFALSPAGYRDWHLGDDPHTWRTFGNQVLRGRVNGAGLQAPVEGLLRTSAGVAITQATVPVWITDEALLSDILLPAPPRRDAERVLRSRGFVPVPGRGKGSHEVWQRPEGGESFSLPHDLSAGVFRKLLKFLELDRHTFAAALSA